MFPVLIGLGLVDVVTGFLTVESAVCVDNVASPGLLLVVPCAAGLLVQRLTGGVCLCLRETFCDTSSFPSSSFWLWVASVACDRAFSQKLIGFDEDVEWPQPTNMKNR